MSTTMIILLSIIAILVPAAVYLSIKIIKDSKEEERFKKELINKVLSNGYKGTIRIRF